MAGLEKIMSQILDDAREEADSMIRMAEQEVLAIKDQAKKETDKITEKMIQKGEAEAALHLQKVQSGSELAKRKELLKVKQEIIADILKKSADSLAVLNTDDYFKLMERILTAYAQPEAGEICFSEKDLKRMPADFPEKANAVAKKKGGSLVISKVNRPVANGFVLVYGMIEENCTISAMFDAKKEELQDLLNRFLFVKNA